ncbi:LPS assembly lipoprotein LptE [Hansschlegelia plantiphila]|uniref:LPS-assembly lipoprotein n=1 Tax=Hansschlegelia plantiphila TaxID=374655 RepID=A0A9W6MU56_9HYPH|nr:LPS assembly lipoprotein LptE [Hansschlegelia plantiphila]GLK66476.1 hypothetical protein GCM10008179_01140 [Hansschlegelia plantiphila]
MSSPDPRLLRRLGTALCLSLLLSGCFRPVYGDVSTTTGPTKSEGVDVERRMKSVEVKQIEGRVGGKIRDELIFMLRGGAGPEPVVYRLEIKRLIEQGQSAVVDPLSGVSETRTISLNANFVLTPAGSLDPVITGNAVASATYFAGLQRFANIRAERDAEDRAAVQIAERIRARLQAYLVTGK